MRTTSALILAAALSAGGGLTLAQEATTDGAMEGAENMEGMGSSGMMDMSEMATGEPLKALMEPMDTMMRSMPMESSGDMDADFLRMMIPHHQSAIDMARIALEQGDDEETRALAQFIIETQEGEIAEMRAMLERMGVEAPAAASE
jgi:uncharacterized protein (DUF305 family)